MRVWLITGLILFLSLSLRAQAEAKFSISGTISSAENGEALIGAPVFIQAINNGTNANEYGYYSISLPAGEYEVVYSYIGFEKQTVHIVLNENIRKDIELKVSNSTLDEVTITAEKKDKNVEQVQMSVEKMSIEKIKKIPAFMGEVDLIKAIQLLPGVQTSGEGSSGMYVRGGNVDQNLILLDEAPVYNASHLLGIFSVFNADAIKDVELYKGGIPANFGGRLSSVLDIRMKEGNNKRLSATGGVGTVSSRLTIEAPIVKDKGSFIISARRTYADVFLKLSKKEEIKSSKLYFYDLNLKSNYKINNDNRLYMSGYFGRDVSKFGGDFGINWGNATGSLRWNHIFGEKLFSNVTLVYSNFDYFLGSNEGVDAFSWKSNIKDASAKLDFNFFANPNNNIKFGYHFIHHTFVPGIVKAPGEEGIVTGLELENKTALEHGLYVSNKHRLNNRFSMTYGVRYSLFQNIGKASVYNYDEQHQLTDTTVYAKGEIFNNDGGLEPRLGMKYTLTESSSVKLSYNRMRQYIQLASNGTSSSPFDIWFPASQRVKAQVVDQLAIGYFKNFKENKYETSVELYYKKGSNAIDFKDHAQLFLNPRLEGELRFGSSTAYGLELLLKKSQGKFSGFISYTLARVEKKIGEINNGETYLAHYDRTHDIAVVTSFEISKKWSVGANWIYQSGRAVTVPTGRFVYGGTVIPVYSDRNDARLPAYHRLDFAATLVPKHDSEKRFKGEWVFSIYNVYARKNAYSINFVTDDENPNLTYAEKTYLFSIIPAITYNFKF